MSGLDREREVFEQALPLPAGERAVFLTEQCRGDEPMRARLEVLLAAADEAGPFMGNPTAEPTLAAATRPDVSREGPGTVIGRYKLLERIGEGGFGTVFMAEQREPMVRRVALKIIKLGMDTRAVIARFEAERQALAMMDHPNIAKVLDAGATETGRPYFVMDLVRGEPINEYCDRNNLSVEDRLGLFEDVCHAVQHAHQKGIIHRDIKPSNVLVTSTDGKAIPKVIDFGIAKATAGRLTEQTLFTEQRQLIGTPEYMSPEQAEMTSSDIDTRSDIYSLGVLLYELLTGALPFDPQRLRSAAFGEIQRIIREEDPPKPSTRLSTLESLPSVASHRKTEPGRLSKIIRGDLDWIVMKCLEKDRTRRYETANGLAVEVGKFLAGEPVVAAPPSATYRIKKFVRRHRAGVTAVVVMAALLLAGVAGTLYGLIRAEDKRIEAVRALAREAQQRTRAEDRERDIARVAAFQSAMLDGIDAAEAGIKLMADLRDRLDVALAKEGLEGADRAARVSEVWSLLQRVNQTDAAVAMIDRTILTPAVKAVNKGFESQPLVRATLRLTLGDIYRSLGHANAALSLIESSIADRSRILGPDHPDTLEAKNRVGGLLVAMGRLAEAEKFCEESLRKTREILGEDHPETLRAINSMGYIRKEQGKPAQAEPFFREALERRRRVLGGDHEQTLTSMHNLAFTLQMMKKPADAERYFTEAQDIERRVLGDEHPTTLTTSSSIGALLVDQGRLADAEAQYNIVLEKRRRVLGNDHPDTLASIFNLGSLIRSDPRRTSESAIYFDEAVDRARRVFGKDHSRTLGLIVSAGTLYMDIGKPEKAEPLLRECMEARRRLIPPGDPQRWLVYNTMGNLGASLVAQGKFSQAEPLLLEVYESFATSPPPPDPRTNTDRRLIAIQRIVSMYEEWHKSDPDKGYDAKAAEWKGRAAPQPSQGGR